MRQSKESTAPGLVRGTDRIGQVEQAGVEYIPEDARTSKPRNLIAVFVGSNLTWAIVIYGWLPVALGLDFWSAFTSTVVGMVLGCVLMMPVATIGPRTGTNMTVASSAFFGVRGRFIGSILAFVMAIVFGAIAVWTSGDALVAASHRLLGTPDGNWARALAYAVVSAGMIAAAVYGHTTIVALQKLIIPVVGVLLIVGVVVFAPRFNADVSFDDYALGGYWQTWILSAVLGFATAPSYVTSVGDYTRRISQHRYSDLRISGSLALGLIIGNIIPMTFGMFTAASLLAPTDIYINDMINESPAWYVIAIVIIALAGGVGQGVLNLYSSGLDLEGIVPSLSRVQTTTITAVIAVALLYIAAFLVPAVESITAATLVVNAMAVPWATILVIGAVRNLKTGYDVDAIQAFADGRQGGRYWFTGGWNLAAVAAWLGGALFGVLAVDTELYHGPLAGLAGGVDLSCIGSAIIAAVLYLGLGATQSPRVAT